MVMPWRLKKWTGSVWGDAELRYWNGSSHVAINGYYWDGDSWEILTDRTPPTQDYDTLFGTHYGATYTGSGSRRTDSSGLANCYQGYNTSTWGLQKSMYGYDVNMLSIMSGLVSSNGCYINLDNTHTWYNDGGTAVFGTSAQRTTVPNAGFNWTRYSVHQFHWNKGENKTVGVSTDWGWWAADASFGTLTLFANNTDEEYYGYYTTGSTFRALYTK